VHQGVEADWLLARVPKRRGLIEHRLKGRVAFDTAEHPVLDALSDASGPATIPERDRRGRRDIDIVQRDNLHVRLITASMLLDEGPDLVVRDFLVGDDELGRF
jgi:hypothetical protein